MRYIRIPADSSQPVVMVNDDTFSLDDIDATLKAMQREVGGYVERVRVGHSGTRRSLRGAAMLVDEEGRLKHLPFNDRAGVLYGTSVHGQPICGDAVIIGEYGPDWTDLPESFTLEALERLLAGEVVEEILA